MEQKKQSPARPHDPPSKGNALEHGIPTLVVRDSPDDFTAEEIRVQKRGSRR